MNKSYNSNYFITSNILFYSIFLLIIFLSILSIILTNFIHLWIIIEINTLIFISIIAITSKNFKATFNFFLIQSISRLIIIFLLILKNNLLNYNYLEWTNFILIISFSIKIGIFPFFYWPPLINLNLNWIIIFLISTTQKFIPLLLLNLFINRINNKSTNFLLILLASLSSIFSTIICLNENNIKKIITYSSLNHLRWIIFIIIFDLSIFLIYYLFYSISIFLLCSFFNKFNINTFINFIKFQNFNYKKFNFFLSLNLLIIRALPPFLTFIIKINAIKIIIERISILTSFILTLISIFTLIFYINIIIKLAVFRIIKTKYYFTNSLSLKFRFYSIILLRLLSLSFIFILYSIIN